METLCRCDIVNVDITKSLVRTYVGKVLATGDCNANKFGVNVFRDGEPVDLTGCGVLGYFIRPDMDTLILQGVAEGNTAYVVLPQACYTTDGAFSLAIKVSGDDTTHTVRVVDGQIRLTQTGNIVDPGEVIPSLDDLFAQIAAMEEATKEATTAASAANAAREGIQDDLDAFSGEIAEIKDITLTYTDVTEPVEIVQTSGYVTLNGTIRESDSYYYSQKIPVKAGDVYTCPYTFRFCTAYSGEDAIKELGADSANNGGVSLESYVVPAGVDGVIFSASSTGLAAVTLTRQVPKNVLDERVSNLEDAVEKLNEPIEPGDTTFFDKSPNLFDKTKATTGRFWDNTKDSAGHNSTYFISDYIPVKAGETIYLSSRARFITAFDSSKQVLKDSGKDGNGWILATYTVPDGVTYIVFTGFMADYESDWMVNTGDALMEYQPYGEYTLRPEYIAAYVAEEASKQAGKADSLAPVRSLCGGNSVIVKADNLASGTKLDATDFPYNLKKGVGMTFYSKFDTFASVEFGQGYTSYRGMALRVDGVNVSLIRYNDSSVETVYNQNAHGLNISGFLSVHYYVGNDFKCRYTVETLGGMFSGVFGSDAGAVCAEMNGAAYCLGGQNMTDVELKAVALDIKRPIWLFGDSYFGVSANRIIGQLKNLGYTDGCLICGLAGMASNGAYDNNLVKLIAMGGMPKYLVWCEGMNSSAAIHTQYVDKLLALRDKYGFELILYKVPTVPNRTDVNNANNATILATGCRYVDAYKAVGTNDAGEWYDGYLDTDGVHPTQIGAKAIAHRIIIDVPEIMQYGHSAGSVSGDITGDL